MNLSNTNNYRFAALLIVFASFMALTACATPGIKGKPPFVQLNGLRLLEGLLHLDLGVRNVNSEPIFLEQIEFSVTVADASLAIYKAPSMASISANGLENFRFELSPTIEGINLLSELENGEHPSLDYSLEGVMVVEEGKEMKVQRKGHIYPVPGRAGHFR
jgi:LEA14-like dessication related protein